MVYEKSFEPSENLSSLETTPVVAVTASVASEAAQPQPLLHHISRSFLAQTLIFQRRKRIKKGLAKQRKRHLEDARESIREFVSMSAQQQWVQKKRGCC